MFVNYKFGSKCLLCYLYGNFFLSIGQGKEISSIYEYSIGYTAYEFMYIFEPGNQIRTSEIKIDFCIFTGYYKMHVVKCCTSKYVRNVH